MFETLRRRLRGTPSPPPDAALSRRQAVRRMSALGAVAGGSLLLPDEAWAAIESRAEQFGIEPGTVVDAQGRPMERSARPFQPLLGEIMKVGFNFAPRGWGLCEGQILPISSYSALFSLLGTTFGGDGRTTFALPDLRSRVAVGVGTGAGLPTISWGERFGADTISVAALPLHTHSPLASSGPGTTASPTGGVPAVPASSIPQYGPSTANSQPTGSAGLGAAEGNMQPSLGLYHCIALIGTFPSRS